jgi:hypothetical protein
LAPSSSTCSTFPLLDEAVNAFGLMKEQPFVGVGLVISQHLLPSIVPLFEWLFRLGMEPTKLAVLGKCYSSNDEIVSWLRKRKAHVFIAPEEWPGEYSRSLEKTSRKLWAQVQKWESVSSVIVTDHGGFLRTTIPDDLTKQIVCVEHTTQGIFRVQSNRHPCIDMARSMPKKELESPVIGMQVVSALEERIKTLASVPIGVIGCGTIGREVCRALAAKGCNVAAVDPSVDPRDIQSVGAKPYSSPQSLIHDSTLILGCTGRDISSLFIAVQGEKILASCSSGDIEFSTLLKSHRTFLRRIEEDFEVETSRYLLRFIDNGFPVNFTWAKNNTDPGISVTRALTLFSLVQASRLLRANMYLALSPEFQQFFDGCSEDKKVRIA